MTPVFDAFWRAIAYCLHPKVIGWSLLPLVLMVALGVGLGYLFWESAVATVSAWLDANALLGLVLGWLDSVGAGGLKGVIAPLVVVFAATPFIVITSLLLVGVLMTPAMVNLVAKRRFPTLERKRGASLVGSVVWSAVSTVLALLAMLASLPLWLVPPLIVVLPPLIWGWLTCRVFAFDALAEHASAAERKQLMKTYRYHFLVLGVITGYLGALPSVLWASGAMFIAMAPVLVPLAIWIYTLVFAFSSLWYVHFGLAALEQLRHASVSTGGWSDDAAVSPAEPISVQLTSSGSATTSVGTAALPPPSSSQS